MCGSPPFQVAINVIRLPIRLDVHGSAASYVQKCVLHTFLDYPAKCDITHYIEICASELVTFDITLPAGAQAEDVVDFYRDQRASEAMYSEYGVIEPATGRHVQSVGDLKLHVSPCSSQIVRVAPRNGVSETCFNTRLTTLAQNAAPIVPTKGGEEPSFGAWLKFQSLGALSWNRTSRNHVTLEFESGGCKVCNFYWFVYLPQRFEARDESLFVETNSATMQGRQADPQSVMRFEVPPNFSVYSDWAKTIYSSSIMKNRRSVEFGTEAVARLSFLAVDEAYAARISTWSFFLGVILSLLGNAFIATLFAGIQGRFDWIVNVWLGGLALSMAVVLYLSKRYLAR